MRSTFLLLTNPSASTTIEADASDKLARPSAFYQTLPKEGIKIARSLAPAILYHARISWDVRPACLQAEEFLNAWKLGFCVLPNMIGHFTRRRVENPSLENTLPKCLQCCMTCDGPLWESRAVVGSGGKLTSFQIQIPGSQGLHTSRALLSPVSTQNLFLVAVRQSPLAMHILPCVGVEVLQHIAQPFDSVRCCSAPSPRLVLQELKKSSYDMPARTAALLEVAEACWPGRKPADR